MGDGSMHGPHALYAPAPQAASRPLAAYSAKPASMPVNPAL